MNGKALITSDDLDMLDLAVQELARAGHTELFLALGVFRLRIATESGVLGSSQEPDVVVLGNGEQSRRVPALHLVDGGAA